MSIAAPRSRESVAEAIAASTPVFRVAQRRWFKVALWIHRWTGLIATPFFLILCVTGAILIFDDEIGSLLGSRPHFENTGATKPWAELVRAAVKPGERPVSVYYDIKEPEALWIASAPPGHADLEQTKRHIVDVGTGNPIELGKPDSTFVGFILRLHAQWFLGVPGELFGGAIALLVLACLVSGVIIYAPYVRNILFGVVRWRRGQRIVQLDLHNLIGVVILGWALVVTVTGILLAVGTILLGLYQTELKQMAAGAMQGDASGEIADVDRVVAAANAAAPNRRAGFIVYPDTNYSSPGTFTVFLYGKEHYNQKLFDIALVDAHSAKVVALETPPLYIATLVVSQPLHFGNYGGLGLKILWVLCSFATLFITGNGAWLWWRRRQSSASTLKLAAAVR